VLRFRLASDSGRPGSDFVEQGDPDRRRAGAVAQAVVELVARQRLVLVRQEEHAECAQRAHEDVAHGRVVVGADRGSELVAAQREVADDHGEGQQHRDAAHQLLEEQVGAGERAVAGGVLRDLQLLCLIARAFRLDGGLEGLGALLGEARGLGHRLVVARLHRVHPPARRNGHEPRYSTRAAACDPLVR
jgi:hypothetical protein